MYIKCLWKVCVSKSNKYIKYNIKTNNNDTIIIVEQYNIGDALKDHEDLFKSYDDIVAKYDYWRDQTKYKSVNDAINLLIIMLVSFFIILGATSIYAKWSEKHDGEVNNKHSDDWWYSEYNAYNIHIISRKY